MSARRHAATLAAAAALLLFRAAAAEPPYQPDALDGWRLVRATIDPDVVLEGGDCPAVPPGAVTRTFIRGEADAWTFPDHGDWNPDKILRTDLPKPLLLSMIGTDGELRVLPVSRLLAFVYAHAGEEHVIDCEYIGSESPRASAAALDATIVWPVSLLYDWPGVSGAWVPAQLGPLSSIPRYRADFRDFEFPWDERIRLLGAVDPGDVTDFLALPQKLVGDAVSAEVAAALHQEPEMMVLRFSAATDRGVERLWNVQWEGCGDDSTGCAWAWGLLRKGEDGFEPAFLESGRGESSIDVVRVLAVIDLDFDGIDELLAEHRYYEGMRTDILSWRAGRLVVAYQSGYDGL